MSTWIIISWVLVIVLTAINIFLFLKLKQASEQMMKMAFPGTKNMNEAMAKMQNMTRNMNRGPQRGGGGGGNNPDAQLKAAMDMLQQMKKGGKRAVKLYDTELEAQSHAAQDKSLFVETRPGQSVRCEAYCRVAAFCSQRQGLKEAQKDTVEVA